MEQQLRWIGGDKRARCTRGSGAEARAAHALLRRCRQRTLSPGSIRQPPESPPSSEIKTSPLKPPLNG
ncbi:hypothetical protein ACFX1X_026447 [Malus domestica]